MNRKELTKHIKSFRTTKTDKARWEAVTSALSVAKKWPVDIPFPVAKVDGFGVVNFKVKHNGAVIGRIIFNGSDMMFSTGDVVSAVREHNLQNIFDAFSALIVPDEPENVEEPATENVITVDNSLSSYETKLASFKEKYLVAV